MTHSFVSCSGAVVVKKKQLWDQYSIFSIGRKSFWGVQQFWDIHTSLLMIYGNWEVFQPSEIQSIKHQRQFFPPHLLNYSWSSTSILNHLQCTTVHYAIYLDILLTYNSPITKKWNKTNKTICSSQGPKVHQTWMQLLPICIPFSNCMACQKRQNWKRPWPTMRRAHLRSMLLRRRFLNWKTLISFSSIRSAKKNWTPPMPAVWKQLQVMKKTLIKTMRAMRALKWEASYHVSQRLRDSHCGQK